MPRVNAPQAINAATAKNTAAPPPATPAPPRTRTPRKASSSAKTAPAAPTKGRRRGAAQEAAQAPVQPAGRESARPSTPPAPDGLPGEKRITLPLWHSLWRSLQLARVDDSIDTTVRIRAMVELWEHDPRIRARVDKLALERAATLSRGRPRTR